MSTRRIVTLGIALVLLTPILGTQVVAHQLRYAAWLGTPLLRVGRRALYSPHAYAVWCWKYQWYYPGPFDWGLAVMGLWLVSSAVVIALLLKRTGWTRRSAYAHAEWATARDIRKAGLFVRVRK
jgi:type IV secretion system protein VirD4